MSELESKAKTKDKRKHRIRHYKPEDKARWNKKHNNTHLDKRHEYYLKNKGAILTKCKDYRETHKDELQQYSKNRFQNNRKKYHAEKEAYRKVTIGKKCFICGSKEFLIRHHPNYDKPLDVITVCRYCHSKSHRGVITL